MNKTVFKFPLLISFLCLYITGYAQKTFELKSPDGCITLTIQAGKELTWQVDHAQTQIITPSVISLSLSTGEILGKPVKVTKTSRKQINSSFDTPFYTKSQVHDHYNQLLLKCAGNYSVEFRAYNDGVAYRFLTDRKGELTILHEEAGFRFAGDHKAFIPYVNKTHEGSRYSFSFESFYDEMKLSEMFSDSLAILPLLVDCGNGKKAAILECDVEDYPGMFLLSDPQHPTGLKAEFAPYPLEWKFNDIIFIPTEYAGYIAKTNGQRSFPWRTVVISSQDAHLADNDMIQKLAPACKIQDISWIKPGKAAWNWWNSANLTGVGFRAGMNTETFKYFIDFAAANQLEYVVVDAGWSINSLMDVHPEMNIPELVQYGNGKNVGIILWSGWKQTAEELETVFSHYAKMGVKGFKVDFFDNDNQRMIQSMKEIVEAAAENQLLLDLHGFRSTGIQRTYPNVVSIEGVKGLENFKWARLTSRGIYWMISRGMM